MIGKRAVFLVIATSFLVGVLFAMVTPIWQTPDEPTHTAYIEDIAYRHHFPQQTEGITDNIYRSLDKTGFWPELIWSLRWPGGRTMLLTAAGHPPLYYLVCAPIYWVFTPFGLPGQVFAIRIFGILMALIVIWLTYKTAELLFPDDVFIQVMAAVLVGFQPMFLYIMAGVNNDALTNPLFAATFYLMTLILVNGISIKRAIILGVLLGCGVATKAGFVVMIPVVFMVLIIRGVMNKRLTETVWTTVSTLSAFIASAFWLAFWSYSAYTSVVINAAGGHAPGWSSNALGWSKFMSLSALKEFFLVKIGHQYWGTFGWLTIPMHEQVYNFIYFICLVAIVGLIIWLIRAYRRRGLRTPVVISLLMLASTTLGILLSVMRLELLTRGGAQGRYMFMALLPISMFLAVGIRGVTPDWLRRYALPSVALGFLGLCLLVLSRYILPHFYLA